MTAYLTKISLTLGLNPPELVTLQEPAELFAAPGDMTGDYALLWDFYERGEGIGAFELVLEPGETSNEPGFRRTWYPLIPFFSSMEVEKRRQIEGVPKFIIDQALSEVFNADPNSAGFDQLHETLREQQRSAFLEQLGNLFEINPDNENLAYFVKLHDAVSQAFRDDAPASYTQDTPLVVYPGMPETN